jgi:hypothetical protein
MTRTSIVFLALMLGACVSVPEAGTVATVAAANPISEELECMSDCLGGGDSSGESCVERCL